MSCHESMISLGGFTCRKVAICAASAFAPLACPAEAQQVRTTVDTTVSAGASSNPFLLPDKDSSFTGFIEGVISPRVTVADERGSATIGGSARGTFYVSGGYDPSWAANAFAQAQRALSDRFTLRASAQVASVIIGEQFNRAPLTLPLPPGTGTTIPRAAGTGASPVESPLIGTPVATVPLLPGSPDVTLLGSNQRITTLTGNVGGDYRVGQRSAVSIDGSVQRFITGDRFSSFKSYGSSVGYRRSLSELTQVGVRMSGTWTSFDVGGEASVIQPQLTLDTRLSPKWQLSAAAGLLLTRTEDDSRQESALSFSGLARLCRAGEQSNLCVYGTRDAGPSGLGTVATRLNAGASYDRRFNADNTARVAIDISQVEAVATSAATPNLVDQDFTFFTGSAGFNRQLSRRWSAGATASYRRIAGGLSKASDVSAVLSISTRLGALR